MLLIKCDHGLRPLYPIKDKQKFGIEIDLKYKWFFSHDDKKCWSTGVRKWVSVDRSTHLASARSFLPTAEMSGGMMPRWRQQAVIVSMAPYFAKRCQIVTAAPAEINSSNRRVSKQANKQTNKQTWLIEISRVRVWHGTDDSVDDDDI